MREKFVHLREVSRKYRVEIIATLVTVIIGILVLVGHLVTIKKAPDAPAPAVVTPEVATPTVVVAPPVPLIYRIKKGDTLTRIARIHCTSVSVIAAGNNIRDPDKIYAGRKLTFLKGEPCPRLTITKKHTATQEKLSLKKEQQQMPKTSKAKISKMQGCGHAGAAHSDLDKKILAEADCVKVLYGEFIKDAVLQEPRITHVEIVAIMLHESRGDPRAISKARIPCLGLMQLQPPTAKQYGVDPQMIFDPKENIRGSVRILADYTYRYFKGSKDHGLAAYNNGPNSKLLQRKDFDPNTLAYVRRVKKISEILVTHRFAL